jgi:hypothetical protein
MNPNTQADRNEIGRRIARHAASYCANRCDFASAGLISRQWLCFWWGYFVDPGVWFAVAAHDVGG